MSEMLQNKDFLILVVDDELEVRQNSMLKLKANGFKAITAGNGIEALKMCSEQTVNIGIVDYFMPEMTGEELIKKIRETNKEMVIILQTAHSGEKPKMEMLEALDIQAYHDKAEGADKLLEKVINAKKSCMQIREIKRLNDELLQSRARLADLGLILSGVAHNLASPAEIINLAVYNAMTAKDNLDKLIEKENIVAKEDYTFQSTILSKSHNIVKNKAMYMLDMMDAVSKQAFGKLQYPVSFKLNDALKRTLLLLDCELNRRKCTLESDIKIPEDTQIKGISVNLVQVINNLILNATEACGGERSKAELAAYEKDGNAIISVKDFGPGISKEIADKIFKELVTTKEREGTGIGLYVSYNTIKKHFRGDMWFKTTDGEGTCFYISLPIYTKEQGGAAS